MSFDPSIAISALKFVAPLVIEEGKHLYKVPEGVRGLLHELAHMVIQLQRLDGQGNLDGELQLFSKEIRELAFRCEDVVDIYFLKFHNKIENTSVLKKFACMVYNSYPIHQLGKDVEFIQKSVIALQNRLSRFRLVQGSTEASSSHNIERLQDTPGKFLSAQEGFVVGIEEDIQKLTSKICGEENSENLSFVAIVGIGRGGKTTLVKKVYNNPRVMNHFNLKAFVTVSHVWSGRWLLIEILRQLKIVVEQQSTKPALVEKLQEILKDKRYLIVLDDIWNQDAWDYISYTIPNGNGSKIVLTSRNSDLLSSINPDDPNKHIHHTKPLDQKERCDLIHKIAIEGRVITANIEQFESLSKEISRICYGTPLAVVSLAGVLRAKNQLDQRERIKNFVATYIFKGKGSGNYGSVGGMLFLSYCDMPSYLRPCLLYLGMYPEDCTVHTREFVRLWIAEGFVTITDCQDSEETLEDVGSRYLDELVKRCLLIPFKRNSVGKLKLFRVHDLVRDFCIDKANEELQRNKANEVANSGKCNHEPTLYFIDCRLCFYNQIFICCNTRLHRTLKGCYWTHLLIT